jgi:hypothetical protein
LFIVWKNASAQSALLPAPTTAAQLLGSLANQAV